MDSAGESHPTFSNHEKISPLLFSGRYFMDSSVCIVQPVASVNKKPRHRSTGVFISMIPEIRKNHKN
jgi:hypothetical protein